MSKPVIQLWDVVTAPSASVCVIAPASKPLLDALVQKRIHAKQPDPDKRRRRSDQAPGYLCGAQVRAWRMQLGLTIAGAIKLLGMSKSAYIELERIGTDRKRTVLAMRAIKHGIHLLPLQKYEQAIDSQGESSHG